MGGDKSVAVPKPCPAGRLLGWCGGGVRSWNSWGPAGFASVDVCELRRVSDCAAASSSSAYLPLQVTAGFEGRPPGPGFCGEARSPPIAGTGRREKAQILGMKGGI